MKKFFLIALCATSLVLNAQESQPQDTTATFDCGSLVTIKAEANPGYHFVSWSDGVTDAQRQIDLSKDTLLTAMFAHDALKPEFTTTVGGVVVDSLGNEYAQGTAYKPTVEWGTSVEVTAKVTDDCYEFVGWYYAGTENLYSTDVTITVFPQEDLKLQAVFKKKQLTLKLFSNDSTMGRVIIVSQN